MGRLPPALAAQRKVGTTSGPPATSTLPANKCTCPIATAPVHTKSSATLGPVSTAAVSPFSLDMKTRTCNTCTTGNVLPRILQDMKQEYGWNTLPREVVHDKASYMVSLFRDRLNVVFADFLEA